MPAAAPAELRTAAVAHAAEFGVTAASKKYGINKGTISKWAKAAGVETVGNPNTQAATEQASREAEERRETVRLRLWEIADKASKRELELIKAGANLHEVVGARTRAIHDAQLLGGGATSRTEHVESIDADLRRLAEEVKARA